MRKLFLPFLVFMLPLLLWAQDDRSMENNILYTKSMDFGVLLHTRGFGADFQWTRQRTVNNLQLVDLSVYELRHPKEMLLPNPDMEGSTPFVFGKINNLVAIKANYGTRAVLADRFISTDVKVLYNYSFGPVLGWLKPVYYDVQVLSADGVTSIEHQRFNPDDPASQRNIIGYSSIDRGLNQSFLTFGANAKTGLSFEWGKYDYKFYSLETGVMVDAFMAPVPIFATIKNDQVFVNLYLCLTYGTRK